MTQTHRKPTEYRYRGIASSRGSPSSAILISRMTSDPPGESKVIREISIAEEGEPWDEANTGIYVPV